MISGIYQIKNQVNGKRYIGSAINIKKRWAVHLSMLRRGRHRNRHLQAAFDKYGEDAFVFSILEDIEENENLIKREQHCLDTLKPEYNISPTAGSTLGIPCSTETRAKIGIANSGEQCSAETRAKMRTARMGKHHSAETRAKIGAALTGEQNPNYGKHYSKETRRKISEGLRAYWRRKREKIL